MDTKDVVLNFWPEPARYTDELRTIFDRANNHKLRDHDQEIYDASLEFWTVRHNAGYVRKLLPNKIISVSISSDPQQPKIIGQAEVLVVVVTTIAQLYVDEYLQKVLLKNAGSKTAAEVVRDLRLIYGDDIDGVYAQIQLFKLRALHPSTH